MLRWPEQVGQVDYLTHAKYYRCGPGLPDSVQLKVGLTCRFSARLAHQQSSRARLRLLDRLLGIEHVMFMSYVCVLCVS